MNHQAPSFRPVLAKTYDSKKHKAAGWWASEKFDGVRCIYMDGSFFTRTGIKIKVPPFFSKHFPPCSALRRRTLRRGATIRSYVGRRTPPSRLRLGMAEFDFSSFRLSFTAMEEPTVQNSVFTADNIAQRTPFQVLEAGRANPLRK